eukprot:5168118-Pleurochrysis_carterae.AAC.1
MDASTLQSALTLSANAHRWTLQPYSRRWAVWVLPSSQGLSEVRWATCALQPGGQSDAKGVPTVV